jgi:hypothetical protein
MAWLAHLDNRARQWPRPVFFGYLALKWYLVAMGAFALLRISLDRTGIWPLY